MKALLFSLLTMIMFACNSDEIVYKQEEKYINWRDVEYYNIVYQVPSGDIDVATTIDPASTWTDEASASTTPSLYGTSTTIYNFNIPDNERRIITAFQDASDDLYWVEHEDNISGWTSPAALASASSDFLPTIELNDGVLNAAWIVSEMSTNVVYGAYKTSTGGWYRSGNLYYQSGVNVIKIPSDYSPSFEYHSTVGVEYLVVATVQNGFPTTGVPQIYYRSTGVLFAPTGAPSITLGTDNPSERNASICLVSVQQNGNDKLFLFYTAPGESTAGQTEIKYVISPAIAGSGAITGSWSSVNVIPDAYTNHKIDGVFNYGEELLVVTFRDMSGNIALAISDDFGSNWTVDINVDATTSGAPSITVRE